MEIRSAVEDGLIFKTMASSVGTSTSTSAIDSGFLAERNGE